MAATAMVHKAHHESKIRKLLDTVDTLKKKHATTLDKVKAKAESVAARAVHTLEVGAGAFSMGMLVGYHEKIPEIGGIPLDLGLSVAGHVAAFSGLAGNAAQHIHGFSDGLFAHFASVMGMNAGQSLRNRHAAAGTGPAAPKAPAGQ